MHPGAQMPATKAGPASNRAAKTVAAMKSVAHLQIPTTELLHLRYGRVNIQRRPHKEIAIPADSNTVDPESGYES